MSRREEQTEATRAALLDAARELFSERGYAAVGTEEIVQRARVTRGALYHHFADKKDLFRGVHEQMEGEIVRRDRAQHGRRRTRIRSSRPGDRRAQLPRRLHGPRLARIVLLEAPSVLGWAEWREIDERYGLGLVMAGLQGGDGRRQRCARSR